MSRFISLFNVLLVVVLLASGLRAYAGEESRPLTASTKADLTRAAYVMAWRTAHEATEYADALRLTALLATHIGLAPGPAYDALGQFLNRELAANPGRFSPSDDPQLVLEQLLREDVAGFQRIISPLAPEDVYQRYVQLLDKLSIKA